MITISVCLSDIPKDQIVEAKNGKKYVNLVLDERREVGQYGDTHMLYMSQTKEQQSPQNLHLSLSLQNLYEKGI